MYVSSHHAIGLFDSGVGGLTVMQQMMQRLPNEHLIYFGDTARVPYGGKSPETVIRYSIDDVIFLLEKAELKLLVAACNTISSVALDKLRQIFHIPVIGVIEPGAEKAATLSRCQRIAILGTKGTIQSGAYQREIYKHLPHATLFPIACPLFVPIVEENFHHHAAAQLIVREYLKPLRGQHVDTILLGCTHYPLLASLIEQEVDSEVILVDSASTCAEKVAAILDQENLANSGQSSQTRYEYYVSDDPEKFREQAQKIFGQSFIQVELTTSHCNR